MSFQSHNIKIMVDAARKAARSLIRDFNEVEKLQISKKGTADFVTAADLRAEEILVEELQRAKPDVSFLLEEGGEIKGKDTTRRYIIDPLDGTTNFIHGMPHFCISIGFEEQGKITGAVIYSPILDELFWAEQGKGAFVNNQRLFVSARRKMEDGLFATGNFGHGRIIKHGTMDIVREMTATTASIRCLGSAALELAYVAAGRLDGFWHIGLNAWDMAAGILLIREARGMVTDIHGKDDPIAARNIIASNGHLHKKIDAVIRANLSMA